MLAPFRLAIRAEGKYVNCYYAATDTMDGAVLIGSIRRAVCDRDRCLFEKWQALMQEALSQACVDALGAEPVEFVTQPAPEHERSGSA
jgi:hypothetical protein